MTRDKKARPNIRILALGVAFLGATSASSAAADTFTAKVVGVSDGDTITVLHKKKPIKIRLHGVDCPEKAQPFGQKAKQLTSKLVFGKEVEVEVVTKDKYGRTVAKVSYLGRVHRSPRDRSKPHRGVMVYQSLQEELLEAGLAWWYRKYAPGDKKLAELEEEARAANWGLWADKDPVPPWDWRKGKRSGAGPPPPHLPWSEERVCGKDSDCMFLSSVCYVCPACEPKWRPVVGKRWVERMRKKHPGQSLCPVLRCLHCPGKGGWLGTKAMCINGQCAVRDLPAKTKHTPAAECSVDNDCAIAHLRAGGCGTAMPRSEAARIRRETERLCASGKGPPEKCGKMPGCTPGHIMRRAVCRGGRCVGETTQ